MAPFRAILIEEVRLPVVVRARGESASRIIGFDLDDQGRFVSSSNTQENTVRASNIAEQECKAIFRRLIISLIFMVPLFYISMGHMFGWPLPSFFLGPENAMVWALLFSSYLSRFCA